MSLRIKDMEPLETALRRLASEWLDRSLETLDSADGRDVIIHNVRKQLKVLRALLRLFASVLGAEGGREQHCFRDIGRSLSAARDAAVTLDVHAALISRYGKSLYASVGAEVRQALIRDQQSGFREGETGTRRQAELEDVRAELLGARARCRRWTLTAGAGDPLEYGLVRTYRQARRAAEQAVVLRTDEALHELRKCTKDYGHQLEMVSRRWPDLALEQSGGLRRLAELLGSVQDLAVYVDAVDRVASDCSRGAVEILQALAERSRQQLLGQALELCRPQYEEKPKMLRGRLRQRDRLQRIAG